MINNEKIKDYVLSLEDDILNISDTVWGYAELSHHEDKSSKLLCDVLYANDFRVDKGICGDQNAFVARYGSGHPVIGLLGEYDALPNLSQEASCSEKKPADGNTSGHGCGHNLIGTGSLAAALAVKAYLDETDCSGTVIYYGCSGEEYIGVKPFMAQEGYFDDVDCVFAWHPETKNELSNLHHYAARQFTVEFFGKTSHAGAAPYLGRSALDACELMNVGCNYLREHVVSDARIHYAYNSAGGSACNTIPDYCKMTYGVRAVKNNDIDDIADRIMNVGRGAALMTDTTVKFTPNMGYSDFSQNSIVAAILSDAMKTAGPPEWSEEDYMLAKEMTATYDANVDKTFKHMVSARYSDDEQSIKMNHPLDTAQTLFKIGDPVDMNAGSTDVGDVSYVVPTAYMFIAAAPMAAPGHSWYWTSAAGSSMGHKALIKAGETLAIACANVYANPSILDGAKEELLKNTGGVYQCPMEGINLSQVCKKTD